MNAKLNTQAVFDFEPISYTEQDLRVLDRLYKGPTQAKRMHIAFSHILLMKGFKVWVKETREKFDIPTEGFSMKKAVYEGTYLADIKGEISEKNKREFMHSLVAEAVEITTDKPFFLNILADDFSIMDTLSVIKDYVLFSDINEEVRTPIMVRQSGSQIIKNCIQIDVRSDIRIDELREAIESKRKEIIDLGKEINAGFPRKLKIKPLVDFEKDITIFNKYLEVKKRGKYKLDSMYADISAEVNAYLDIRLKGETVKKIIDKIKGKIKLVNLQKRES